MQKKSFAHLMILGIVSGSLVSTSLFSDEEQEAAKQKLNDLLSAENGNMGYHLMTEDELLLELNEENAKTFDSLSPEGKQLALKVASARCNGTNECKGLNACRTDQHKCAGYGECKGQSKCAFSDKNVAVRVVAKKMAEKRAQAAK